MIEAAVIASRLFQYASASILMGSALFALYALPREGPQSAAAFAWPRRLLLGAALVLAPSAAAGLLAQTMLLSGSVDEGLKRASLEAVIGGMAFGKAAVCRILAAAAASLVLLLSPSGRRLWWVTAALGTIAVASFGWMGHAAAGEGAAANYHLAADIGHALSAAVWIGALVGFVFVAGLAMRREGGVAALHVALRRFSAVGTAVVAALILSGLVNAWVLVGPDRVGDFLTTPYGRLLALKLLLFAGMLALAAANRFRHTPALNSAEGTAPALTALRRSVACEAAAGLAILVLVAWLGTLAPPSGA